jgi:hypothetical protein
VGVPQAHDIEGHGVQRYWVHKAGGAVVSLQAHSNQVKQLESLEAHDLRSRDTLAEGHIVALVRGVGGRKLRVCEGLHHTSHPVVGTADASPAGRDEPEVC